MSIAVGLYLNRDWKESGCRFQLIRRTALELLASDRYLEKGMGLDGPDRAQACRDLPLAYDEALRRIREAEETGAVELDLSELTLNRLPRELARLTSLQSLNLAECWQLSGNLSPLARLTSLRSLGLDQCMSTIWLRLGRFVGKHRNAL